MHHLFANVGRQIRHLGVAAQLQRAHVRDDGPAVARRNLRRIVQHRAEAVGDDVEDVAVGHLAQPRPRDSSADASCRASRSCRCRRPAIRGTACRKFCSVPSPRSSSSWVTGSGNVFESFGTNSASSASEPRATVFSRSGRSERPSVKKSDGDSGRFFGCSAMSCFRLQPASSKSAQRRTDSREDRAKSRATTARR